jgi:peptide-methionine (R)-S-oxide reductase
MNACRKNPDAVFQLIPEQYRVTQTDGTERPFAKCVLGQRGAQAIW